MDSVKILVVEDEVLVAKDIKRSLDDLGYAVTSVVPTGEEALARVKSDRPNLILMDIVLKGKLTGIQTAEMIHYSFDIPIIYLTAYSDSQTIEAAKKTEPYGYLLKPIVQEELFTNVEIALYRHAVKIRAREKENRLSFFLDPSADTLCLLDEKLNIVEINRTGLESWGFKERKELIGKNISFLFPLADKKGWRDKYVEVMKTGRPLYAHNVPFHFKNEDKFINIRALKSGDGLGLIIADVTEKRKIIRDLKESYERYRILVENINEGITLQDEKGVVLYVNNKFLEMTGLRRERLVGFETEEFPDEKASRLFKDKMGKRRRRKTISFEYDWKKKDGKRIFMLVSSSPIYDEVGNFKGSITVFTDITERRLFEEKLNRSSEELRRLSRHLESVREKESKRIAREIHDEFGQALTALKMDLSWISNKLPESVVNQGPLFDKLKSMSALIDRTIHIVQKISAELRPGLLDDLGLAPAIEWLAQEFQTRTGVKCDVQISGGEANLGSDCSTAIFRIVQEALTNVTRHALATTVKITMREQNGSLVLEIKDNGKGIRRQDTLAPESLGLIGMRERLLPFGGKLTLSGLPNKGTTLSINIPLKGSIKKND